MMKCQGEALTIGHVELQFQQLRAQGFQVVHIVVYRDDAQFSVITHVAAYTLQDALTKQGRLVRSLRSEISLIIANKRSEIIGVHEGDRCESCYSPLCPHCGRCMNPQCPHGKAYKGDHTTVFQQWFMCELRALSETLFDKTDWKAPFRVLIPGTLISKVHATTIVYHGVEPEFHPYTIPVLNANGDRQRIFIAIGKGYLSNQ